jgi:hypothetical protein
LQSGFLLSGRLGAEPAFLHVDFDGAQHSAEQGGVAADIPARFEPDPIMRLADLGHRAHIGVVEGALENRRPVTQLGLSRLAHLRLVRKHARRFRELGDLRVEFIENARQLLHDQRPKLAQRRPRRLIDANEGETGGDRIVGAHRGVSGRGRAACALSQGAAHL